MLFEVAAACAATSMVALVLVLIAIYNEPPVPVGYISGGGGACGACHEGATQQQKPAGAVRSAGAAGNARRRRNNNRRAAQLLQQQQPDSPPASTAAPTHPSASSRHTKRQSAPTAAVPAVAALAAAVMAALAEAAAEQSAASAAAACLLEESDASDVLSDASEVSEGGADTEPRAELEAASDAVGSLGSLGSTGSGLDDGEHDETSDSDEKDDILDDEDVEGDMAEEEEEEMACQGPGASEGLGCGGAGGVVIPLCLSLMSEALGAACRGGDLEAESEASEAAEMVAAEEDAVCEEPRLAGPAGGCEMDALEAYPGVVGVSDIADIAEAIEVLEAVEAAEFVDIDASGEDPSEAREPHHAAPETRDTQRSSPASRTEDIETEGLTDDCLSHAERSLMDMMSDDDASSSVSTLRSDAWAGSAASTRSGADDRRYEGWHPLLAGMVASQTMHLGQAGTPTQHSIDAEDMKAGRRRGKRAKSGRRVNGCIDLEDVPAEQQMQRLMQMQQQQQADLQLQMQQQVFLPFSGAAGAAQTPIQMIPQMVPQVAQVMPAMPYLPLVVTCPAPTWQAFPPCMVVPQAVQQQQQSSEIDLAALHASLCA